MANKATKKTPAKKTVAKVDAKEALKSIGAKFKEENLRRQGSSKTPRSQQDPKVLRGTWMNRNISNMDTRIDAYHWWNVKENDGQVLPPEDIRVILDEFDS
jgi:hypothetical protein